MLGQIKKYSKSNGFFYDIESFEDMYQKTFDLINDKSKIETIGTKNFYNSNKYTWEKTKDNIMNL